MKEHEHERMTDQGWAAMQQVLDQQMPRRRRRIAGWWWFAGLLLLPILGVTGWQWVQQSTGKSVPAAIPLKPAAPVAKQNDLPATNGSAGFAATNSDDPSAWAGLEKLPDFETFKALTGQPVASSGFDNQRAPSVLINAVPGPNDLSGVSAGMPPATAGTVPGSALINNISVGAVADLPTPFKTLEKGALAVGLPDYAPYVRAAITKVSHKAPLALGLTCGVNSERLPRVSGGLAGAVVDWQPLRRWGMRSGLQYAMQRLASDESLVATIVEDAYEKSSENLALFDNSGNYGNISQFSSINTSILASVRRIHRIETPLLVYWQPMPAFRMYAGATLNYTFLAQTSNRIFSDNQVFKVVSGHDEINRLATERLQRWQVKWQAGLGYRWRCMELNGSIQTSFPKISFKRTAEIQSGLDVSARSSSPFVQVRQLGVTLSGIAYF